MNPIEFNPVLKRIRWGGRRLETVLGKQLGPQNDYAESWEICDHGDDQSIISSGPYTGWKLSQLVQQCSLEVFGEQNTKSQFPLLIKYLDCNDRLSVQVHPNDLQAVKYNPDENGKTEAWVVISAEPGSFIYAGLKSEVTPDILKASLKNGTVEDCLHRISPVPGECYYIPAGTVHALGEGVLIAEVQQTSDMTFRLFDWNRTDAQGNHRPVHIEQALECIDFQRGPIQSVEPNVIHNNENAELNQLIDSPFFRIDKLLVRNRHLLPCNSKCKIVMSLSGKGNFKTRQTSHSLSAGKTFLIPATCDDLHFEAEGDTPCSILIATVT